MTPHRLFFRLGEFVEEVEWRHQSHRYRRSPAYWRGRVGYAVFETLKETMTEPNKRVRDVGGIGDLRCAELSEAMAHLRTLGDLTEWTRTRRPPLRIDEIVTQDEYTHDVLVSVTPSEWLAFDVT